MRRVDMGPAAALGRCPGQVYSFAESLDGFGGSVVMQVSSALRRGRGRYFHWCPACEEMHPLPDSWTFNGDFDRPTFVPSFKHGGKRRVMRDGVWTGEWHRGPDGEPLDGTCHYTITGGMIQFHMDSWHKRSDIIAMPPIPTGIEE